MPVLLEGVDVAALALADTAQAGTDAATAIMTTDTVSKEDALTVGTGASELDHRRHDQGSGHAGPRDGHHARRHHH